MTPKQFEQHMAVQAAILEELKAVRRLLTAPVVVDQAFTMGGEPLERAVTRRLSVASGAFELWLSEANPGKDAL